MKNANVLKRESEEWYRGDLKKQARVKPGTGLQATARMCILIAKSGNKRPLKFVSAHCEHTHVHMLCPDVDESKSGQSGC